MNKTMEYITKDKRNELWYLLKYRYIFKIKVYTILLTYQHHSHDSELLLTLQFGGTSSAPGHDSGTG